MKFALHGASYCLYLCLLGYSLIFHDALASGWSKWMSRTGQLPDQLMEPEVLFWFWSFARILGEVEEVVA